MRMLNQEIRKQREEQIKLKMAAHMEEYKAVRAEILQALNQSHQLLNFTLAAIAALTAASKSLLIDLQFYSVFILSSFLFYCLIWFNLRLAYTVIRQSAYIEGVLDREVAATIDAMAFRLGCTWQ